LDTTLLVIGYVCVCVNFNLYLVQLLVDVTPTNIFLLAKHFIKYAVLYSQILLRPVKLVKYLILIED